MTSRSFLEELAVVAAIHWKHFHWCRCSCRGKSCYLSHLPALSHLKLRARVEYPEGCVATSKRTRQPGRRIFMKQPLLRLHRNVVFVFMVLTDPLMAAMSCSRCRYTLFSCSSRLIFCCSTMQRLCVSKSFPDVSKNRL